MTPTAAAAIDVQFALIIKCRTRPPPCIPCTEFKSVACMARQSSAQMQIVHAQSLPRALAKLWREQSCALLQRWQHTSAERSVDPFVAQLQSKTEAELMELLSRNQRDESPQREADADDADASASPRSSDCLIACSCLLFLA